MGLDLGLVVLAVTGLTSDGGGAETVAAVYTAARLVIPVVVGARRADACHRGAAGPAHEVGGSPE